MTPEQLKTARNDFIEERTAILIYYGKLPEQEAIVKATEYWERYRRQFKVYANEQKGIF